MDGVDCSLCLVCLVGRVCSITIVTIIIYFSIIVDTFSDAVFFLPGLSIHIIDKTHGSIEDTPINTYNITSMAATLVKKIM